MKAQTPFLSLTRPVVLDSEGQKPWSHVIRFSPSLCPWKSTLSSTFLLPSSVVISHCLSTCPKAFRIRLLHRQFMPFLSINHCFSTSWFYRPWNSQCFLFVTSAYSPGLACQIHRPDNRLQVLHSLGTYPRHSGQGASPRPGNHIC